jgi:putative chitinase
MREITAEDLQAIVPGLSEERAALVAASLNPAMAWAGIDTLERQAPFIAQCAHESDHFKTMREYASGRAYEGREDLGNTEPGNGVRFKGRGFIQVTGRANYTQAGADLNLDLVNNPELAESPEVAGYIAAWFWLTGGNSLENPRKPDCNDMADRGDFRGITKRINGQADGPHTHLAERIEIWERAKEVLGA